MEKPALELVLQVLDALYRNEDASEKEKASSWLMKLQASVRYLINAHFFGIRSSCNAALLLTSSDIRVTTFSFSRYTPGR